MTIYVFDMDGTLTPARLSMTDEFKNKFLPWLKNNIAYIATGSDIKKVEEQMPLEVMDNFTGIYCSMGNVLYKSGKIVYEKEFKPVDELILDLENFRKNTKYPNQLFENYIEFRKGAINFSVLGRNCLHSERIKYASWDEENKERLEIQKYLQNKYPQYDFSLGGNISMDIVPKGCGKGQVANLLRKDYLSENIVFFGDRTFEGGNDYELACALKELNNTQVVQVENPQEVLRNLKL